jgi:uncharacterized membrane protein YkvA (DUF1232 family)
VIGLAVLAGLYVVILGALLIWGRPGVARRVATFLPNLALLFKGLLGDPRVPRRARWVLVVAAAWIASPIDLIPEFIPVLGPLDDALVAALALRMVVRAAGPAVITEHWRGDAASLELVLRLAGRGGL